MSERRTEKLPFIDWLRFCSMISIILCHMVQIPISKVAFTAQVFNLGVQVFFLVSGFSLGLQGEITDVKKWCKHRFKKIFVPYTLFVVVLFSVYCFNSYCFEQITPQLLIATILGMQGFTNGLLGATHTWFITSILIFYILLIPFSKIWFLIRDDKTKKSVALTTLATAFIFTYLLLGKQISVIIAPVFMSMIAYAVGTEWKDGLDKKVNLVPSLVLLFSSGLLRLLCIFIKNQKIETVLVAVSVFGIAFGVCALFSCIFKTEKSNRFVSLLTGIGFEVYLYHNMFIEGPVYLMYKTDSLIFNIVITTIAIFASAFLANKAVVFLNSKRFKIKKGIDS